MQKIITLYKLIATLFLLFFHFGIQAQNVINSNGGSGAYASGSIQLDWTVGESVVGVGASTNYQITHGFLQPSLKQGNLSCLPMSFTMDSLINPPLVTSNGACYPNLGCLTNVRNISYKWIQTTSAGEIHLKVEAVTPANIDFAVWGPFNDTPNACTYLDFCALNIAAPIICDVNPINGGDINISNVSAQSYYLIGIVNTANKANTVNISERSNNTVDFNCGLFRCISAKTTTCLNDSYEVSGEVVLSGITQTTSPLFVSSSDGFATSFQAPLGQSYSYRFTGLAADGTAKKILANVLDVQSSKIEKSYTAPATCTQTVNQRTLINPNFDYNSTYEAGYTNGSLNISDMGSASYSIPLILPQGTGGVQPTLNLAYNSAGGNNILGSGWSLEGLSAISRTGNSDDVDGWTYGMSFDRQRPSTVYPVNNIVDKLSLDGEKLIQVNYPTINQYLKGGAEYRTYNNSFNKIVAVEDTLNSPKKFKVWTKSGLIYEYGYTQDSRIESTRIDGSSTGVLFWLINKISDTKGNYMTFEYQENQYNYNIKKINYTGNVNTGLVPSFSVNFDYINRVDTAVVYRDARRQDVKKLLQKITVKSGVDVVRSYSMTYVVSGINATSRLTEIQECGANNKCLQPTKFVWETEQPFAFQPVVTDALGREAASNIYDQFRSGDFNGDGLADYAIVNTNPVYGNYIKFYQNKDNLRYDLVQTISITELFSDNTWLADDNRSATAPYINLDNTIVYLDDMDGDNATDIFVVDHKNGYNLIVNSNPNVFNRTSFKFNQVPKRTYKDLKPITRTIITSTGLTDPNVWSINNVDLDGNGIPEIFINKKSTGENAYFVRLTSGVNITYIKSSGQPIANADLINKDFQFLDVNGDGRPEIVYPVSTSTTYGLEFLHMLDDLNYYDKDTDPYQGFITKHSWYTATGTPSSHDISQYSFSDMNGDGLPDIQYRFPIATGQIRLDCYTNKISLGVANAASFQTLDKSITFTNNDVPIIIDFSLDSRADYITYNKTTGKNHWFLNKGGYSFSPFGTNLIDSTIVKENPFTVTGLRKTSNSDVFWIRYIVDQTYINQNGGRPSYWWKNTYAPSMRIEKIINGFGTTIKINYTPLIDSEVYKPYVQEAVFANFTVPLIDSLQNNNSLSTLDYIYQANRISPFEFTGRMYVVKDYEIDNALGDISRMKYNYEMAVVSRAGAGFRGFGRAIIKDVNSGVTTYRSYKLDQYGAMRLYTVATGLNNIGMSLSTNLDDSKKTAYTTTYGNAQTYTYNTFFSYTKEAVAKIYDVDGSLVSTITNKMEVDDFGNTVLTEVDYGDGHKDKTTNTFTNNTTSWLLGRLTNTMVTRIAPNNPTITKEASFVYDPVSGLLTKEITEPNRSLTTERFEKNYEHDAFGNVTKTTIKFYNGTNLVTRNSFSTFDATGRYLLTSSNDLGHSASYTYDTKTGHTLTETDPNGLTSTMEYDNFGRMTKKTNPDGNWQKTEYFKCGTGNCPDAAVFYTIESNSVIPYVAKSYYDKLGREVKSEDPGWNGQTVIIENRYNYKGSIIATSDPHFANEPIRWSTILYDNLNREIAKIDAGGVISKTEYVGLVMTKTNPLGQRKIVESLINGRTKKITDEQGNIITYEYDTQGNNTKVNYPGGNSISTTYDFMNRRTALIDPDMGTYTYEYNAGGELIKQTDPKGNVVTTEYDILGRVARVNNPEFYTLYTYDVGNKAKGKLSSKVQRTTGTTTGYITQESYTFDNLGRPSSSITNYVGDPTVYTCSTEYDAQGRVQYLNAPGPNGANASVKYEYNTESKLVKVRNKANNKIYWELYNVDSKGKMLQYQLGGGVITTDMTYDTNLDFLLDISAKNAANQNIQHLSYEYNLLAMPTQRKDIKNNLTEIFQYDNLNRLLSAEVVGKQTLNMTYDVLGNILTKSDVGTYTYGQNGAGPHVLTSIALNSNKCIPSALVKYNYTSFNKVKSMVKGLDSMFIDYGDSYQRFRQMTYRNNALVKTKRFVTCGLEREVTATNTKDIYYISSPAGTIAVETFNSNTSLPAKTEYWLKDNLGSLQTVVSSSGAVIQTLSYDPWGKRRNADGTAIDTTITGNQLANDRGFTGHEHLDLFDLINMNGRIYDPMLGRFTTADIYIQDPSDIQSLNRYAYVMNNPLAYTDPSGHLNLKSFTQPFEKAVNRIGSAARNLANGHYRDALNDIVQAQIYLVRGTAYWDATNEKGQKAFGAETWGTIVVVAVSISVGIATSGVCAAATSSLISSAMGTAIIAGATSGFAGSATGVLLAGGSFSDASKAGLKGAIIGAVSGALSQGVSQMAQDLGSASGTFGQRCSFYGVKTIGHGVVQGGMAKLRGDSFESGFLTGAIVGGTEDLIGSFAENKYLGTAMAALVGGTTAEIGGGKFKNGAISGAMTYMFNKLLEEKRYDELSSRSKSCVRQIENALDEDPEIQQKIKAITKSFEEANKGMSKNYNKLGAKIMDEYGKLFINHHKNIDKQVMDIFCGSRGQAVPIELKHIYNQIKK